MKWIKQFIHLRRQNDVIKIITILFIICAFCIISSVIVGISFYKKQNEPVSYIFDGSSVSDKILSEIKENKDIKNATPQKSVDIQFLVNGESIDLMCLMISKGYLEEVMGLERVQSNVFYANKKAMDMIGKEKSQSVAKFMIQSDEGELSYKNCQIVILSDKAGEEGDIPVVYCGASSNELKDATEAIILLEKHDLDGSIIQFLSDKGFQVKERTAMIEEKSEMNATFIEIKYRLIILIVCLVNGFVLKKYALHVEKKA